SVVRAVLTNARLQLADGLAGGGPLRTYLLGQRLRNATGEPGIDRTEMSATDHVLAAFKADESRTALADAIHDLLLGKEGDLPAAIVVMTDGLDNASKMPLNEVAQECARLQVPLHMYGVGSAEGGVLQIKDIGIPETLFYDDNSPRWEYKLLQSTILRDRRVDANFLLVNGDTEALQAGPPFLPAFPARDRLFGFDLVILGDVAAEYFGTEKMTWLRDFVN